MKVKNQFLLLAPLLLVSACFGSGTFACSESAQAQQQLNDSRAKWASKNLKDYQYTFNWSCFCTPNYTKRVVIAVRNGVISAVKYADGSGPIDKAQYPNYRTIDGLFEFLQDAINRKAYQIVVSYDAKFGYPTAASIDYDQRTADEEKSFKAGELN